MRSESQTEKKIIFMKKEEPLKDKLRAFPGKLEVFVEDMPDIWKIRIFGILLSTSFICMLAAATAIETSFAVKTAAVWLLTAMILFIPAKYIEMHTDIPDIE